MEKNFIIIRYPNKVHFVWKILHCSEHCNKKESLNNVIKCGSLNTHNDFL